MVGIMKIAIMTDASDLSARVCGLFSEGQWLLIVDDEEGKIIEAVPRDGQDDLQLAVRIVRSGCEGVLCGPIDREPFLMLADEGGVSRYQAAGLSAQEALEKFRRRELEFIRDHIGGQGHAHQRAGGGDCSGRNH